MPNGLQPVGIALILSGGLVLRQVAVGRAGSIATDLRDYAGAAFSLDGATLSQVASRRGKNLPDANVVGTTSTAPNVPDASGSTLAMEMERLANIANHKYRIGTEGPDSYDCSGLVWRALVNLGYYNGSRFTTQSFPNIASGFATLVTGSAQVGDIVVWPTNPGHMGVVVGNDLMYSALNTSKGIVTCPISAIHGETPQYWRLGPAVKGSPSGGGKFQVM